GKIGTLSYYVNSTDLPTPPDQSLNFSIDETYYSTNAGTVDLLRHETTSQLLIAIGIAPSPAPHASVATQLRVYPNPTRELLNIVVAPDQQIQSITLTDMAGRRLFSPTLSTTVGNRAAVSVQHLPEGMYLVEVQTDVGVGVQRVLVK
ncbi:MAG TPA: T9SS type A sorting domain-containing protein, partial [Chitinophagales bacterium]|nr:T9SS type A sorting domain-containing protein [Chitinophagales bacterium]